MSTMQWDESLSVGVTLIDEQHKAWIERFNAVCDAVEAHKGPEEISKTLSFLLDYTEMHFSTEEKHMTANDYPQLEEHRSRHEELKSTLDNLVQDFEEEGATHSLALAIDSFMGTWLVRHITNVDRKLGDFLKEKGIVLS